MRPPHLMNAVNKSDSNQLKEQVRVLSASAKALVNRGEMADAEKIYTRILSIAPYHASSRSFMAAQAFSQGDSTGALMHLEKALQGNPHNPFLLQSRALIYKNAGRHADALKDLDEAIRLEPGLHTAKLHKAFALRDSGDWNGAIKTAVSLMRELPELHNWKKDEATSAELTQLAVETSNIVRAAQLAFVDAELQQIAAKSGAEPLRRVFEGVAAYAGLREKDPGDQGKAGRGLWVPELDPAPTLDPALFGWLSDLQARLPALHEEVRVFMQGRGAITSGRENGGTPLSRYVFAADPAAIAATPSLTSLLQEPWLCREPDGKGGMTLTRIPSGRQLLQPASGENWHVTVHLVLESAGKTEFIVAGTTHGLTAGEAIVATDAEDHEFQMAESAPALLLSLTTWHPGLSAEERRGLAGVYRAFQRFRAKYL